MSLPTITAHLDDGTGTFPYDVTEYLRLTSEMKTEVGRGDELEESDPTEVTLRLDNLDGRFSLGSAQYGCRPDQQMRIRSTQGSITSEVIGRVQAWPTQWDADTGKIAYAAITVVDDQARLNRTTLGSMLEAEARRQAPTAYWPINEPEGSTSAGVTVGSAPALTSFGSGAPVTFASAEGPPWVEGQVASFAGGKTLAATVPAASWRVFSVSAIARTTTIGGEVLRTIRDGGDVVYTATVRSDGRLLVSLDAVSNQPPYGVVTLTMLSPDPINDGAAHQVGVLFSQSGPALTLRLYIDGVLVDGNAMQTPSIPTSVMRFQLGRQFAGSVSHVVLNVGADLDHAGLAGATLTGFAGETAAARLARIGAYVGVPTVSDATTVLGGQQMAGESAWAAMQAVEKTEGGRLWVDKGLVTLDSRKTAWERATGTPRATVTTSVVEGDLEIVGDKQFLQNRVSVTADSGAAQTVENAESISFYGVFAVDLGTILLADDRDARYRAEWAAAVYGVVRPRMSAVTVDLLTKPPALQQAILSLRPGDRFQVTSMPSQSPVATADLVIEGWTDVLSLRSWRRTFNTSPAQLSQPLVLDSATFGALDQWPLPY